MSKLDFEFYSLAQGLPEFVVPKPNNDYYGGLFVPSVEALGLNGLRSVMEDYVPYEYSAVVSPGRLEPAFYFVRDIMARANPHDYATLSHTAVEILIPGMKDVEWHDKVEFLSTMTDWTAPLHQAISRQLKAGQGKPLINPEGAPEAVLKRTTPVRRLVYGEYVDLSGEVPEPVDDIHYSDFLLARAYRWLRGPERKSKLSPGTTLPGVYQPKAFNVLMGNSVKISLVAELSTQET